MEKSIFNARLKATAKEQGYTQNELSEKMHVSVDTVKKWYTKTTPDLDTVRKLANILNVDIAYLLGDIDCKHHEEQTIQDVLGLSEEACLNLLRITQNRTEVHATLDEILSSDITADEFAEMLYNMWIEESLKGMIEYLSITAAKRAELSYLNTWSALRNLMNNVNARRIFKRTVLVKDSEYYSIEDIGDMLEEKFNP